MGLAAISEIAIPMPAQESEIAAAQIVTPRKVLNSRMAERAGKVIRADTKSAPKRFMATTTVTPVMTEISRLKSPARVPVAEAKSSSKVTANMRL